MSNPSSTLKELKVILKEVRGGGVLWVNGPSAINRRAFHRLAYPALSYPAAYRHNQ